MSELLAVAGARYLATGGLRAGGRWAYRAPQGTTVKLDAVLLGNCWLVVDDSEPLRLQAGDAVVLTGAGSTVLCADPRDAPRACEPLAAKVGFWRQLGDGRDVAVVGGHVELDAVSTDLFASALPGVLHARAASPEAADVVRLLERLVDETDSDRPGAGLARDAYAQLLLVAVLRIAMHADAPLQSGWLRLLSDVRLRPAVAAMHADPARAWGLDELASKAGLSRSHFAQLFRQTSGQPPVTYLASWRTRLAQRALRDSDDPVGAIGQRLGYASESSFTHAFTRLVGVSPRRYREATRARPRPG